MCLWSFDDSFAIFSGQNLKGIYGDDFPAKCGHCNGIQVNDIKAQGTPAKSFALATKKTLAYCGKCICLYSKTTPSNHVRTEKASGLLSGQQASKS